MARTIDLVSGDPAANGLPQYVANPGGSPFNVAMAAGRQGQQVAYLTPISDDALGDLLAERLVESRVSLAAPRVAQPTSLAIVSISDGIPSYAFHRNGTAERQVTKPNLHRDMPEETRLFHVGSLGLIDGEDADVWEEFFRDCQGRGIMTSLDPNVRPGLISDTDAYVARLRRMMRHVDIFKLSDEDLAWLYPDRRLSRRLPIAGRIVTRCCSSSHSALRDHAFFLGDTEMRAAAATIDDLADTVGAGDTYMASILRVLENGHASRDALAEVGESPDPGNAARGRSGGLNCRRSGCNPPWRDELANSSPIPLKGHKHCRNSFRLIQARPSRRQRSVRDIPVHAYVPDLQAERAIWGDDGLVQRFVTCSIREFESMLHSFKSTGAYRTEYSYKGPAHLSVARAAAVAARWRLRLRIDLRVAPQPWRDHRQGLAAADRLDPDLLQSILKLHADGRLMELVAKHVEAKPAQPPKPFFDGSCEIFMRDAGFNRGMGFVHAFSPRLCLSEHAIVGGRRDYGLARCARS